MMKRTMLAIVAAALGLVAGPASAVDFHAYFRSSVGGNSNGGGQDCFQTPNMDYKWRLGNECETYGEADFQQSIYKDKSGVEFKYELMFAYKTTQNQDYEQLSGSGEWALRQTWIGATVPQWGNTMWWAGKRYYHRNDIHVIDFYYWDVSGHGAGVDGIDTGFGKLNFAVLQNSFSNKRRTVWRPDVRLEGVPLGAFGSLDLGVSVFYTSTQDELKVETPAAIDDEMTVSPWFTIQHNLPILGGMNKLAFQYAMGSAAPMSPYPGAGATSDAQQWRIVDHLVYEPHAKISGAFVFVYQDKDRVYENPIRNAANASGVDWAGDSSRSWTLGTRGAWHFTDYVKTSLELGYTSLKPQEAYASGGPYANKDKRNLFKATFAPTLTPAPGPGGKFWTRPELRLFVTYAKWNDASRDAGLAGGGPSCVDDATTATFDCDTNGVTFGAQVEAWW